MRKKSQDIEPTDLDTNDAIARETAFPKEISFFRKAANKDIPVSHAKVLLDNFLSQAPPI